MLPTVCARMSNACVPCPRCGRWCRRASISPPSNGRPTEEPEETRTMAYSEKVIDHYENPRNVGSLDKNDEDVGTGIVGAPACGDVMKLQIRVQDGVIVDARFKTYGCGS